MGHLRPIPETSGPIPRAAGPVPDGPRARPGPAGPPTANDAAMAPPEHADGQAADPAAERSNPAAARLDPDAERLDPAAEPLGAGVLCYQCTYDLVGRVPGEPCPECGLDVAASWPAWDLRACHRVCVDQAYGELLGVRVVLTCVLVASGAGALAGLGVEAARALPSIWSMVMLLALFAAAACAAAVPALFGLLLRLRRVGHPAALASEPARRWLVISVRVAMVLLPAAVALGLVGMTSRLLHIGAMLPWSIVVLCAALVPLAMASWAHADATVRRAGRPRLHRWPVPLIAAPALAGALVPVAALVVPSRFDTIAGGVLVLLATSIAIARQDTGRAVVAVEAVAREIA